MLISPDHKVTRGSIGIQFQAATSSAVQRMYGAANGGVIVNLVTPGGPAAKAGLQPKDVIVAIDGQNVKDGDQLVAIISAKKPGSTVKLTYLRDGKRMTSDVGIADRAKLFADLGNASPDDKDTPDQPDVSESTLGITVQPTAPQLQNKLSVKGGVTVTTVKPGSFADTINLAKGDVIVEINRKPVNDIASFQAIVSGLKSGSDVVFVVRSPQNPAGGNNYVGGTLP
jgi:serine protease Do